MNQKKMNEFYQSLNYSINNTDSGTFWPGGGGQIGSAFIEIDAFELHCNLIELKKTKTAQECINYFYNPSVIRYVATGNFIIGLKFLVQKGKITIESAKESLDFLFDILDAKMADDTFCGTGKNLWLDKNELNKIIESKEFIKVDEIQQKLVSRLIISLNSLVWSFYYDIYVESGFEFHGPYDVDFKGKKYSLLIKDYHNLRPVELWDKAKDFPLKSIKCYLLYKDIDIQIDYLMHETSNEPLRQNLVYCAIETIDENGKQDFLNINDSISIIKVIEDISFDQVKFVNDLEIIDKIKMGARICYYQLKDFRNNIGLNWEPSKKVFEAIDMHGIEKWEKFGARAKKISSGEANIDWSSKYNLDKPI
ncbi:MAG: hypothetical protein WC915_04180 [archaeon]